MRRCRATTETPAPTTHAAAATFAGVAALLGAFACDDHDACTLVDNCVSGACVGTTPPTCLASDACASAGCDPTVGCFTATANFDATGFSSDRVDGRDVAVLAGAWNSCPGDLRYNPAANLEPFGTCIDLVDFHLFMITFGRTCSP